MLEIEQLYTKYAPMVYRRCIALLKDEERAMDAVQDVFVKLLEKHDKLELKTPSSLLYTIATNHCLNIIRDEKKQSNQAEVLDYLASSEDLEQRVMEKLLLEEIFTQEHDKTRLIAYLHYMDRMTLEQTADFVGMSVSGIRKRLRKLRTTGLKHLGG